MPENGSYPDEMVDAVMMTVEHVYNKRANRDTLMMVEQRVTVFDDLWGTADVLLWSPTERHLEVIDFKYGKGVRVSPEGNPQLLSYAVGACKEFVWKPGRVTLTIAQPRAGGVSSHDMVIGDLYEWYRTVLQPAVAATREVNAPLRASADACRWCPAKAVCPEAERVAREAARVEFEVLPDSARLAELLPLAEQVEAWANGVREYALRAALDGHALPGFKLVEGRSVRKWTDEQRAARAMIEAGLSRSDVVVESTVGITTAERLLKKLGRDVASNLMSEYTTKPRGKPALAPESDRREPWDPASAALDDFN
jgi:hypothetical protein